MKSKKLSTIAILSILAFVLITIAATGRPTTSFENVLAEGENMTGMSQDQTSGAEESTALIQKKL